MNIWNGSAVCNAQGGKIYIGKNDEGTVVGVKDAKKLLEDIPNKIQNKLGIACWCKFAGGRWPELYWDCRESVGISGQLWWWISLSQWKHQQQLRGNARRISWCQGRAWSGMLRLFPISRLTIWIMRAFRFSAEKLCGADGWWRTDLEISNAGASGKLNLLVDGKLKELGHFAFTGKRKRSSAAVM